jgi:hypothetical protein
MRRTDSGVIMMLAALSSPPDREVWYRYEDYLESSGCVDVTGEYISGPPTLRIREVTIPVIRYTPKGVWLGWAWSERRLVCHDWRKRYACKTQQEALKSFICRKERQISIHESRAKLAHIAKNKAMKMMEVLNDGGRI